MSRQKIIVAPPDLTGTPMERFERILRRVVAAPKELWSKPPKGKPARKRRK